MIVLASGDSLRGSASVAAVVDFSFHGLNGAVIDLLAEGQLPVADGELFPAAAIVVVKSMVLVNTHSAAVTINLTILKAASTARRLIPKDMSLGIGYSLCFDGARLYVINASGEILNIFTATSHATSHQNGGADEISVAGLSGLLADDQHVLGAEVLAVAAAKGANNDITSLLALSGAQTIPSINLTGGQIAFPATAVPSADSNTLDDYEEGTWTPAITCQTPGDLSVAYTYQNGLYTKVGNHVSVTYLTITSAFTHTTASGAFRMSGLPFTSGATVVQPSFAGTFSGLTKANYTQVAIHIIQNASVFVAYASAQGQTYAEIQITDFPTAGSVVLIGSSTYFI